ncbi:MAG: hypothetical protein DLM72_17790 [Candidatus Nitrosopolaris wilkensis]|nr:MAG: hypothetical protein DLM72_17790 [Candidatus Nitrosopolaris wilkensis]
MAPRTFNQFNNTKTYEGMDFANIANTVSANQDEEVWAELHFFRDRKHLDDVGTKMKNDECWSTIPTVRGSYYPGICHRRGVQPPQSLDIV